MTHSHRPSRHRSPTASTCKTDMDDTTTSHKDNAEESALGEPDISDPLYSSSFLSNGGTDQTKQEDEADGLDPKTSAVLDHLGSKIVRVRDLIKTEQKLRDGQCVPCIEHMVYRLLL